MMQILLIEDDRADAQALCRALDSSLHEKFNVYQTGTAREAMHYLRNHRNVDLVLSEVKLPDMNGDEAFQLIRRTAANVPVVLMTGSSDTSLAIGALQLGAQDYLVKGEYSDDYLVRVIRYAIERKKYQDEVSSAKAKAKVLRQKTRMLRQEQAQLLALNKAKDEFISLASHQLRTPATGVKQYVGMLLEGFAGDIPVNMRDFLERAYESNERQLSIVNDLLRVAQLDAGNIHLSKDQTDLKRLLESVINEQSDKYKQRQQRLELVVDDADINADIDRGRMRMVLENLIDNASKYTPEGKLVTVGLCRRGKQVAVSVRDEGVGIAQADLAKIFKKFSRVTNDRSELVGGSGLGLYWAKRIVDLHGGTIEVQSQPGQGSEFTVVI